MENIKTSNNLMPAADIRNIEHFSEFDAAIQTRAQNIVINYIEIGYLLRQAEDRGYIHEGGYNTVAEYAAAKLKMNADMVSRLIKMNRQYSENGYSPFIRADYAEYAYTKLVAFLDMPDGIIKSVAPETTRSQIREIRHEWQKEQEITEIERQLGEKPAEPAILDTNIKRFIYYYYKEKEHAEEYVRLYMSASHGKPDIKEIYRILAPTGVNNLRVKIPTLGARYMLGVSGMDKDIKLTNMRTGEFEDITWQQLIEAVSDVCLPAATAEESWEAVYGEDFPGMNNKAAAGNENNKNVNTKAGEDKKEKNDAIKTGRSENKSQKIEPAQPDGDDDFDDGLSEASREKLRQALILAEEEDRKEAENRISSMPGNSDTEQENNPAPVLIGELPYIKEKKEKFRNEYNYLGRLFREGRFKQAKMSAKEIYSLLDDLDRAAAMEEIPGQMSFAECMTADGEENHEE